MSDKSLVWIGSTLDTVRGFPDDARRCIGYELRRVQLGLMPSDFKPLPGVGPGTYEIRVHTRLEYRVIYVAKFDEAVYVLHAFGKKSRRTTRHDIEIARRRLAMVRQYRKEVGR